MNCGRWGRSRDTNTANNLLIFEAFSDLRPQSHLAPHFFNIPGKGRYVMSYIVDIIIDNKINKYIHNYICNILYIILYVYYTKVVSYIQHIACSYVIIWDNRKNLWARWDCGQTTCELLKIRACETSRGVPAASTSPHFLGLSIKDKPVLPETSAFFFGCCIFWQYTPGNPDFSKLEQQSRKFREKIR